MAFSGTATKTLVARHKCVITGLSLPTGISSGEIGNAGTGAEIELPAGMAALDATTFINVYQIGGGATVPLAISPTDNGTHWSYFVSNFDASNATSQLRIEITTHHTICA